ncbi:rod shape-determining protein MreC [Campylobacter sp. RM9344]|uniref:Rod shape-determining protein MreC n=1 Tax=Campylobacter californiensis TaxID=1032243 RepID=A0AAW3ZQX3_9BACT|nr:MULTISPECIES: rod shape-determining protein MreC [unclassified Campylobacter]MBE2985478.1 rod shape-determining protein MreC [Campylobacter sp. RM6883]MBE2986841.1 rod shape-determining protein MreC [Campylobacter sp. RM12919]MBE2988481.1 rod shape-determining protein MreC [Campylobacter sp. RM12920]MBE2995062.1 rod shape-determining protein MreC [Campylobacter sp. RM6913]MBE3021604.1 rod shape-determining protein MreC [Campylobacter sp. 7477a]MBE3028983.1 rod shape-determining protein Mre
MKTKITLFALIALLIVFSVYKGGIFTNLSVKASNYVINFYDDIAKNLKDKINEHFRQVAEIKSLREQNAELERSAMLLSTFANELNEILKDKNATAYAPKVRLVKGLSYANIGDYNKIWITEFEGYDPNKIYGLIYQGKSAGVVIQKDGKPLALLQNDPKSLFSVYIGNDKIPGIAHGNKNGILIKFIPQWLRPKIGDEVFTSGLDGAFFSGVPVGKVSEIFDESLYQSVLVEPYAQINIPSYLYVVTKER